MEPTEQTLAELLEEKNRLPYFKATSIALGICLELQRRSSGSPEGDYDFSFDVTNVTISNSGRISLAPPAHAGRDMVLFPGARSRQFIYSTGLVYYRMLTGVKGDISRPIFGPGPRTSEYPDIPIKCDAIVQKSMSDDSLFKSMSNDSLFGKYQTIVDMAIDLREVLDASDQGTTQSRPGPLAAATKRPASKQPTSITVKRPTLTEVSEAPTRRIEWLGEEVHRFRNGQSSSSSVETIVVRHTSRISASVDLSRTRSVSGNVSVKFLETAKAGGDLRAELARHYSLGTTSELTYEQSTAITIPPHTNVEVTIRWQRIWASGMMTIAELANPAVKLAELPFEITVGLAFEKDSRDIAAT